MKSPNGCSAMQRPNASSSSTSSIPLLPTSPTSCSIHQPESCKQIQSTLLQRWQKPFPHVGPLYSCIHCIHSLSRSSLGLRLWEWQFFTSILDSVFMKRFEKKGDCYRYAATPVIRSELYALLSSLPSLRRRSLSRFPLRRESSS